MYPADKEKDASQSGTGIYYQAIPAVGADGKNIMKLIPVQMVNGQFFQTDISKPRTDSTPQKRVAMNISSAPVQISKKAALNPPATQQSFSKQVSSVNALCRPVELDHGYSLNKHSLQQRTVNLTAKVPPIATPASNCDESVRCPCRLPVTVKSPALPKGHHILIPPNAQVQTVQASELPPGIKKQIFVSSDNSSPASGLQSVVYVSPVTTVIQGATPPVDSAIDSFELLSEKSNKTLFASQSKGSKPHLKLIPKVSQRPNSPIKWVIEEDEDSSMAPDLNPLNSFSVTSEIFQTVAAKETEDKHCDFINKSPSVTSEILRALAERETGSKHREVIEKTISQSILGKSGKGQENALVMCNGKVFFLAKKCTLPFKIGQNDPPTSATKSYEFNRTIKPLSQQSVKPNTAQAGQDVRIIIPDESDDVIDLCDDDDATQQDTSVDEDNVIFVSYIPPKAESASQTDLMLKSQMAPEKKTTQMGTSSSNCLTDKKQLDGRTGNDDKDEGSTLRGRQPGQTMLVSTGPNVVSVWGSAVMNMHKDPVVKSQQSTFTQQVESVEVHSETEIAADPCMSDSSSGTRSQKEKDTHKMESSPNPATYWASSLAPEPCQVADHLLRKIFGITADVNICLQRIDETSSWSGLAQPLQIHQSTSKTNSLQHFNGSCQNRDSLNVKRVKLLNESEFSADPATPTPHTDVTLKNKCHSGQSSLCGTSCDGEHAPVIGYVEPIDEDFLSTCVELNTNTRRIGRTRKRTMCSCCTPGTLDLAVKSGARLEEAEKWAWTTEQMRKKDGRAKAPGKDGKTSGKISCLTAKSKQTCKTYEFPASDTLTTTSTDFNKLKYDEQMDKLIDLQKEEEAALELMRNRMN